MCTHVQRLQSDYFNSKQLNKRFKKFHNLMLSFSGFYFNKNMYFEFFILLKMITINTGKIFIFSKLIILLTPYYILKKIFPKP